MRVVYAKTETKGDNKIIILRADLHSLRCRQRNTSENEKKKDSMRFVSFREMQVQQKKNKQKVVGPFNFYTICKL